jgi:hypothetical protein
MAGDDRIDPTVLDRLFSVAPEEFVATRAALAKELKAADDKATAALVGKLRRPTVPDWLLNVVAREHPDETGAFVDAADRLRTAQAAAIEGKGDPDLRGALQALRQQTGDLLGLANDVLVGAGKASGSQAGPLATRLADIATTPASTRLLRAGLLGSEDVASEDLFADLRPPAGRGRGRAAPQREPAKAAKPAARARPEGDDRAAAAEAKAEAAARAKALAAAQKEQQRAAARLAKADERVEAASAVVADAEERLANAREKLGAAQADRDEAAAALEQADAEVATAS